MNALPRHFRAAAPALSPAGTKCAHCGLALAGEAAGERFCCAGCASAFAIIRGLGLDQYYTARRLDPSARPPRPEADIKADVTRFLRAAADGASEIDLAVDGVQCGACVWLIENMLAREAAVISARVNMTTRRLRLRFRGGAEAAAHLVERVEALGYRLVPFDPSCATATDDRAVRALLRPLAVAGFAAGNGMLLAFAVWAGLAQGMGPATRALLQAISALIALPAIAYAGMPFFRAAARALRGRRVTMDVPISLGLLVVTGLSLADLLAANGETYFESATMLLFFLLLGRVLDQRARGQTQAAAAHLLALRLREVTVLAADGSQQRRAPETLGAGEMIIIGAGERVGADGVILRGQGSLDASVITGESDPVAAAPGARVFAGSLNLGAPLVVRVERAGESTVLAEAARLIEQAAEARGRYVALADRMARLYAPGVHGAALLSFLMWWLWRGASLGTSLTIASAVLIITCPCALALAVPMVQVVAAARLFRAGVLLKSATALERLASVDTVVFDKTGTLTCPSLTPESQRDASAWRLAAGLAGTSRHPLARVLASSLPGAALPEGELREHLGAGLTLHCLEGEIRLGSRDFCQAISPQPMPAADSAEIWLTRPGAPPYRFAFTEAPRAGAASLVAWLARQRFNILLASGDRAAPVARIAGALGIARAHAELTPAAKCRLLDDLRAEGGHVLMVGDGLNDGPALAAATVSASPASATDLAQTVADVVFQGRSLMVIADVLALARRARAVMRQNLGLALGYNLVMVPLAMAGAITPWLAAAAMSASSLTVVLNSLRLQRR
ncbi:MAG: heavy metal translocating P-type ATPase [Acidibrevibacterium sp.]|uniref:heavy metal translocating P-type ATPase n=1 Tax=Acidibrevibacterium sp. TaxID=2606776 RepID=UPI003D084E92